MEGIRGFARGAALLAALWLLSSAANPARAQDAKELYQKNCSSCHGPNGKGDGPAGKILKPPPGDLAKAAEERSDADLAKIIKEGGKAVGRSAWMPAYGSKLNDEQINAVVQLVKGFASK